MIARDRGNKGIDRVSAEAGCMGIWVSGRMVMSGFFEYRLKLSGGGQYGLMLDRYEIREE